VFVIVELRLCVVLAPGQVVQFSRTIVLPSAPVVAAISQNSRVHRGGLCWRRRTGVVNPPIVCPGYRLSVAFASQISHLLLIRRLIDSLNELVRAHAGYNQILEGQRALAGRLPIPRLFVCFPPAKRNLSTLSG
jgi:hypothetical protein